MVLGSAASSVRYSALARLVMPAEVCEVHPGQWVDPYLLGVGTYGPDGVRRSSYKIILLVDLDRAASPLSF